jgi:hypothetical protein
MQVQKSLILVLAVGVISWYASNFSMPTAQEAAQNALETGQKNDPERFCFDVTESFDAQYLGDTPGHLGRSALGGRRPNIALGDPVFRDQEQIGTITELKWNRSTDSLEVEFDPLPNYRIFVGSAVWVHLDGSRYDKLINRPKIVP